MNISSQAIAGSCSFKCNFSYNYPESSGVTVTNTGTELNMVITTKSSTSPVTYNNIKCNIVNVTIRVPSMHLYNGSSADAEISIVHRPVDSGSFFCIYIPINTVGASSTASTIISNIIEAVAVSANSQGQNTNKISDFTLNDIVPMKPFYTYTDPTYDSTNIVYGIQNAITISTSDLQSLQKCISPQSYMVSSGPSLFLNSSGPSNNSNIDGDIYIDCQPTGSSEDEENIVTQKTPTIYSGVDYNQIMNNPVFLIFISSLFFLIILLILNKILTLATYDAKLDK